MILTSVASFQEKPFSYSHLSCLLLAPFVQLKGPPPMDRKVIFDSVRQMIRRRFVQAEVIQLDHAIDLANETSAEAGPIFEPAEISAAGIALIQEFEGCARKRPDGLVVAYPDPGTGGAPWRLLAVDQPERGSCRTACGPSSNVTSGSHRICAAMRAMSGTRWVAYPRHRNSSMLWSVSTIIPGRSGAPPSPVCTAPGIIAGHWQNLPGGTALAAG